MASPLDTVGSPRSPCDGAHFVHAQIKVYKSEISYVEESASFTNLECIVGCLERLFRISLNKLPIYTRILQYQTSNQCILYTQYMIDNCHECYHDASVRILYNMKMTTSKAQTGNSADL